MNVCPRLNKAPKNNNNAGNQRAPTRGRVYVIGAKEARHDPNVMNGMFLLNGRYLSILFDIRADRSFVSLEFRPLLDLKSECLKDSYTIEYVNSHEYEAREILLDSHIVEKDPNVKLVQDIPVVKDHPKVFPEDFPGPPPPRQVEFQIDRIPGAAPVAKAEFISWGPPILFVKKKDGSIINAKGIQVDPAMVEVVKKCEISRTPIEIRQILGLAGYY
nr:hypothetical protein [Tanacetum cinerariifolium]